MSLKSICCFVTIIFCFNGAAMAVDRHERKPALVDSLANPGGQFKPGGPITLNYTLKPMPDGLLEVIITASSPKNFGTPEVNLKAPGLISKESIPLSPKNALATRLTSRNRYRVRANDESKLVVTASVSAEGVEQSQVFYIDIKAASESGQASKTAIPLDLIQPAAGYKPAKTVSVLPAKTTISQPLD